MIRLVVAVLAGGWAMAAAAAQVSVTYANDAARAAAQDPRIAAAIEAGRRAGEATISAVQ
ncbi:MAG: hypothetical protein JO290_02635 [Sphingomonadaceae bacterium]|nr:hypothetical protein [Sphingomonadaceae bacterium]